MFESHTGFEAASQMSSQLQLSFDHDWKSTPGAPTVWFENPGATAWNTPEPAGNSYISPVVTRVEFIQGIPPWPLNSSQGPPLGASPSQSLHR